MKRLISLLISIIFLLNTSLAYTITLRIKGMDLVVSEDAGNVVELEPKISGITGWDVKTGNATVTDNKFIMPEGDVLIEAIISENKYLLTVETEFFIRTEYKTEGENVILEVITDNEKYNFTGWTATGITLTDEEKVSPIIGFDMPANDVVLVANYTTPDVTTYTITYNANGGSGEPSAQTKTQGVALTLSSTKPTKSGYKFLGWSTSSTATSAQYSPGGSFTVDANTTLYAVWEEIDIATIPIGSYIAYQPSSTSCTVLASDSGYTSDQTYNPSSITSWKVFKNNSGQLDIISSESVGDLTLRGETGYAKAVYTLNNMCSNYVNPTYATSGKSLGYKAGSSMETIDTSTYPLTWDYTYTQGNNGLPYTDTYYIDDQTIINTAVDEAYPLRNSSRDIWLTSRFLNASSSFSDFAVRRLSTSGSVKNSYLCSSYPDDSANTYSNTYGVRPVVSLKSGLQIVGGDGSSTNPYVIQ